MPSTDREIAQAMRSDPVLAAQAALLHSAPGIGPVAAVVLMAHMPEPGSLSPKAAAALAERYGDHPAVVAWHISNELGCHNLYDYSDDAARAFRVWLEARGLTLDIALVRALGGGFAAPATAGQTDKDVTHG